MKFTISAPEMKTFHVADTDDIMKLEALGFEFEPVTYGTDGQHTMEGHMELIPREMEIDTLEGLLKLRQAIGHDLIIEEDNQITIYNDYIE